MVSRIPKFPHYIGTKQATRILDKDTATVLRWGRQGRIKIVHQNPGKNGAVFYDRASVEKLAAQLAHDADDNGGQASA